MAALFCSYSTALGQDEKFKVVYVQGQVLRANGTALQVGEMIGRSEKDNLQFKDQAIAAIFHARVGRIVLPETGELASASTPRSSTGLPTLRDEMVDTLVPRINNGRFLLLGKTGHIDLFVDNDDLRRTQLDKSKFYLKYVYQGDTLRTDLEFNTAENSLDGDYRLVIQADKLFHNAQGASISQAELEGIPVLYVEKPTMSSVKGNESKPDVWEIKSYSLGYFAPIIPEQQDALKNDVQLILNALQATPNLKEEQRMHVLKSYLTKYYGPPSENDLRAWLAQNFSYTTK